MEKILKTITTLFMILFFVSLIGYVLSEVFLFVEYRSYEEHLKLYECDSNKLNCEDFESQIEAQATFNYCMMEVGYDVHYLDGDQDGRPCEALS